MIYDFEIISIARHQNRFLHLCAIERIAHHFENDIDVELIAGAAEKGWIQATSESIAAANSITMHAVSARYADSPDINCDEAYQAVLNANAISRMIAASGYDVVSIDTDVILLRYPDEARRFKYVRPALKPLDETQAGFHDSEMRSAPDGFTDR